MNDQSLFSPHWYRVKDISPWLASDITANRHVYRKKVWYVLHRQSTGSHYRVDVTSYELISSLDGTFTVDQLWQRAMSSFGEDAPSQDQVLSLLAALHEAELLVVNQRLETEHLFHRKQDARRKDRKQRFMNPLYIRLKLFDPDALLNKLITVGNVLFSRRVMYAMLALLIFAAMLVAPAFDKLLREVIALDVFAPSSILTFLIIYPLLKLLHEFGHALAVKSRGGQVHDMGIALMVLLPIPYVDASASAAYPDKRDRMIVDSAGIVVELSIAALAAIVWVYSDGLVHSIALMLLLLSSFSTVLFNGNPLLKFDGYYLLADWLEIPNLAARARSELGKTMHSLVFRKPRESVANDRGERAWLLCYSVISGIYRFVLMMSIAWMLSGKYLIVGVLLALFVVCTILIMPIWRVVGTVANDDSITRRSRIATLVGIPALLMMPVVALPLPLSTTTSGVVWLPDDAVVRVKQNCEVVDVYYQPGANVLKGDRLFTCEDPELDARVRIIQARVDELSAKGAGLLTEDPVAYQRSRAELNTFIDKLGDATTRQQDLEVHAQIDGRFDVEGSASLFGRYLEAGDIAAYVVPSDARTVRVLVSQSNTTWLDDLRDVSLRVKLPGGDSQSFDTTISRTQPEASMSVPSAAFTTDGGGVLLSDPASDGRTLLEPAVDLELEWPENAGSTPIGTHIDVRFQHSPSPLIVRWKTFVQRAFLGRIDT